MWVACGYCQNANSGSAGLGWSLRVCISKKLMLLVTKLTGITRSLLRILLGKESIYWDSYITEIPRLMPLSSFCHIIKEISALPGFTNCCESIPFLLARVSGWKIAARQGFIYNRFRNKQDLGNQHIAKKKFSCFLFLFQVWANRGLWILPWEFYICDWLS